MKSILSFAIGLIALFTVTTGFTPVIKANPHFVSGPCLSGRTIQATIAGLGSGAVTTTVSGSFICVTKGGGEPKPHAFSLTKIDNKRTGGNYKLNFSVSSLCPNPNFTFRISDLHIIVSTSDGTTLDQTFEGRLPTCR